MISELEMLALLMIIGLGFYASIRFEGGM